MYDQEAKPFSFDEIQTKALVKSVYDGDTIKCIFGLQTIAQGKHFLWNCRIIEIDTPEIRGSGPREKAWAYAARDRVRELIGDKEIDLEIKGQDKYGRLLTKVRLQDGGDLGDLLVTEGLAVPYSGSGEKMDWENSEPPKCVN